MSKSSSRFVPLLVSIGVVLGILIGSFYANHYSGNRLSIINTSSNKVSDLFHLIDDEYVDSVNISDLVERSLPHILMELDPHSVYISADKVEGSMQDLRGSFSGIGIQFLVLRDTVRVVRVLPGGPSAGAGIEPGDCIVAVDNKPFVGKEVSNDETLRRLKGEKGSTVAVTVYRRSTGRSQTYKVVRGDVPVQSIDAAYMVDKATGYIRIKSFGETTYAEFLTALAQLGTQGFESLILDLRGNVGGYMAPAVQIANEFLPKNRLIVYTKGRKSPREEYSSDGRGSYQTMPLVILVDETTASASEILAGAMQDNDRATIIGRRTFGKGLVQVPIEFRDGSMLRLTRARYYTPSGRCLQKPYTPGQEQLYDDDLLWRAEHGEYFNSDSIRTSGEKYHTLMGRVVYGGGGIIPDVFVARDTVGITSYFRDAYFGGHISAFTFDYVDRHRSQLARFRSNPDALVKWTKTQNLLSQFASYAERAGLKRRNLMLQTSSKLLMEYIVTNMLNDLYEPADAIKYANSQDPAIAEALKLVHSNATYPTSQSQQQK